MKKQNRFRFILSAFVSGIAISANAIEVCEYTPSKLIGATPAAAAGAGAVTTAVTGLGMKALGLYAIQNGVTGAWMLGSTAAGASAAGITGILAGTAGTIGMVGAVLMSTPVIVAGAFVAVGVGAYEGGCHLTAKRKAR